MRFLIILTIWTVITAIKVSAQEGDSLDSLLDSSFKPSTRRIGFTPITKAGDSLGTKGSEGRLRRKGFSPVLSRGRSIRRRHLASWGSSVVSSSEPKEVLSPSAIRVLHTSPRRSLPEPPAITKEKEKTAMPSGPVSVVPPSIPASPFPPPSQPKYGRRSAKPPSLPGMAPSQPTERDKPKEVVPAATAVQVALRSEETVIRPSRFSVIEEMTSSEEDLPPWLQD